MSSKFSPYSQDQLAPIISARNEEIDKRHKLYDSMSSGQRASGIGGEGGGTIGGLFAFMGAMQGVANMQQAVQQGRIAGANHDMVGQLNAAVNAGTAEIQTLNAISDPGAAPIQPLATPDPTAIPSAANQQLANIQAQQASQQRPQQIALAKTTPSFPVSPPPNPVPSSGTAPPPTCVDLGPGNCVPIAQYQQMQAQKQKQGVVLDTLCPSSGFVPGVMTHPAPDVALGVQCKPGSVIYINGVPQFDTAGTGLGTVTPSWTGSSAGNGVGAAAGSSNGGGPANATDGPPEVSCIQLSADPSDNYPVFHNTCSFAVKYYWTPFSPLPGEYPQQNGVLQPGETQTGAEAAVGGYRIYACQTNYLVVGSNGLPITGVVSGFRCVKP
jgi:hypothetical protein